MTRLSWSPFPPPGRRTGCNPRKSKAGEVCSLFSEKIKVIDPNDWDQILADRLASGQSLKGRSDVRKIKDQDGVGSCACEATCQAMEVTMVRSGQPWEELNPWSLYRLVTQRDDGSSIDEDLQVARDVGVLPVSFFPRYDANGKVINRWNATPPDNWKEIALQYRIDEFFDITTVAEAGTALIEDYALVFGYQGHSECMEDLLPKSNGDTANSWGTDFEEAGFHVVSLQRIDFRYGCFAVRTNKDRGL